MTRHVVRAAAAFLRVVVALGTAAGCSGLGPYDSSPQAGARTPGSVGAMSTILPVQSAVLLDRPSRIVTCERSGVLDGKLRWRPRVSVWDLEGRCLASRSLEVDDLAAGPNGDSVFAVGQEGLLSIHLEDLDEESLAPRTGGFPSVAGAGRVCWTTGQFDDLFAYDAATGTTLAQVPRPFSVFARMRGDPATGRLVLTGDEGLVAVIEPRTSELLVLELPPAVERKGGVELALAGGWAWIGDDASDGPHLTAVALQPPFRCVRWQPTDPRTSELRLAATPDGTRLAITEIRREAERFRWRILFAAASDGVFTVDGEAEGATATVPEEVLLLPDGQTAFLPEAHRAVSWIATAGAPPVREPRFVAAPGEHRARRIAPRPTALEQARRAGNADR